MISTLGKCKRLSLVISLAPIPSKLILGCSTNSSVYQLMFGAEYYIALKLTSK